MPLHLCTLGVVSAIVYCCLSPTPAFGVRHKGIPSKWISPTPIQCQQMGVSDNRVTTQPHSESGHTATAGSVLKSEGDIAMVYDRLNRVDNSLGQRQRPNKMNGALRKRLQCSQCHYTTNKRSNLNQHKQTHLPKEERYRPLHCAQCNYATNHKGNFKMHMQIHLPNRGESKPFQCEQCHYASNSWHNLNQHRQTHLPKEKRYKPLQCAQCSYATHHRGNLRAHEKTHLPRSKRRKPFRCDRCGYATDRKSCLKQHELTHRP